MPRWSGASTSRRCARQASAQGWACTWPPASSPMARAKACGRPHTAARADPPGMSEQVAECMRRQGCHASYMQQWRSVLAVKEWTHRQAHRAAPCCWHMCAGQRLPCMPPWKQREGPCEHVSCSLHLPRTATGRRDGGRRQDAHGGGPVQRGVPQGALPARISAERCCPLALCGARLRRALQQHQPRWARVSGHSRARLPTVSKLGRATAAQQSAALPRCPPEQGRPDARAARAQR